MRDPPFAIDLLAEVAARLDLSRDPEGTGFDPPAELWASSARTRNHSPKPRIGAAPQRRTGQGAGDSPAEVGRGEPEPASLTDYRFLRFHTEGVFAGPVMQALETGIDPSRPPPLGDLVAEIGADLDLMVEGGSPSVSPRPCGPSGGPPP